MATDVRWSFFSPWGSSPTAGGEIVLGNALTSERRLVIYTPMNCLENVLSKLTY